MSNIQIQKITLNKIALTLLLLYAFNIDLLQSNLFPNSAHYVILVSIPLLLLLSILKSRQLNKRVFIELAIALFILLGIIVDNADLAKGSYSSMIQLATIVLSYVLLKNSNNDREYYQRVIKIFFLEHIILTWLFFIFSNFYISHILNIFDVRFHSYLIYQFNQRQMAGITAHYSHNAMYLAMSTIYFFTSFFTRKNDRKSFVVFIVSFGALLLTGKRAHLLFSIVAIIFSIICYLRTLDKTKYHKTIRNIITISSSIVVLFMLAINVIPELNNVFDRISAAEDSNDITSGRSIMYERELNLWKQHQIKGAGWGSVKYFNNGQNGHNVYLQILAERGLLGIIIFTIIIISMIRTNLKVLKEKSDTTAVYSIAIVIFFLFYCLTGNPLYDPHILFPSLSLLAINVSSYKS